MRRILLAACVVICGFLLGALPAAAGSPGPALRVSADAEEGRLRIEADSSAPVEVAVVAPGADAPVSFFPAPDGRGIRRASVPLADFDYAFGQYFVCAYRLDSSGARASLMGTARVSAFPRSTGSMEIRVSDEIMETCARGAGVSPETPVWTTLRRVGTEETLVFPASFRDGAFFCRIPLAGMTAGAYEAVAFGGKPGSGEAVLARGACAIAGVTRGRVAIEAEEKGNLVVSATAEAEREILSMRAAVWTGDEQDDLLWLDMRREGDEWRADVDIARFGHRMTEYTAHAWAELDNQVLALAGGARETVFLEDYARAQKAGATFNVYAAPSPGENVRVAVWSEEGGQDDIQWLDAGQTSDGSCLARIPLRRYERAGRYVAHVYAGDRFRGATAFEVSREDVDAARETKGIWAPSVYNLDFPTTHDAEKQREEFRKIVSDAAAWNFNALFVQVRPHSDALYPSALEPWSSVLTGVSDGDPGYDPLAFMVETAHEAGLELHAWLNPYRVGSAAQWDALSGRSFARRHPELVLWHGSSAFLDPARPEVREHVAGVVREILTNYAVDGIHFDDYFYPYDYPLPEGEDRDGAEGNARRSHVTEMVRMVSRECRSADVEFGISPFGVWKNASSDPAGSQTRNAESYYSNFCDTLAWIREGLVDYVAPQLYWTEDDPDSGYATLLDWWARAVNGSDARLLIGQGICKPEIAAEIERQLELNESVPDYAGSIYYRYGDLASDPALAGRLAARNARAPR